jgi:hypothetical protein
MARQLRFQDPGALYQVMARGNGGDAIFVTDDDRKAFSTGWDRSVAATAGSSTRGC